MYLQSMFYYEYPSQEEEGSFVDSSRVGEKYAFIYLRHSHTWCLGLATNIILTPIKVSRITIPQFLALQVINFFKIISTCPHMILISNYNWVIILKFAIQFTPKKYFFLSLLFPEGKKHKYEQVCILNIELICHFLKFQ